MHSKLAMGARLFFKVVPLLKSESMLMEIRRGRKGGMDGAFRVASS
ncbi:hypothetical protein X975_09133, partial [Stegodyphus mimosarum]